MKHINELHLSDVAPDLALLVDESAGEVNDVICEVHAERGDLIATAPVGDDTRTFRLTAREED